MKKLILLFCFISSLAFAQTRIKSLITEDQVTVTFSATPTFDASKANVFKLTLTGNVTSSTLSNAVLGQPLSFEICQDGTGGRTFVPPANVSGWVTISSTASTCTMEFYLFDGTNAMPNAASVPSFSGDVSNSGLVVTVAKVNGVAFPSGPSTHSVPVVTASNTVTYKVITDCTDTNGNHLNYTQSTDAWNCGTSVPANVVTTTGTQNLSGKTVTDTLQVKRIRATQGTNLVSGDFALSAGWGTTASVSGIAGNDQDFTLTVNSSGTGQSANPTLTLTYHDGTWTNTPIMVCERGDGSAPATATLITQAASSATAGIQQLIGTPVAGNGYIFWCHVGGR